MVKGRRRVTGMTAKTKKVCKWLLSLGGKGRLILWDTPVSGKTIRRRSS